MSFVFQIIRQYPSNFTMKLFIFLSMFGVAFAAAMNGLKMTMSGRGRADRKPHILHIVADDLGWDDVSWHNPDMITPNLQDLADNGVILDNMYVQTSCSPTRSSLMSGYYAANIGAQHLVYKPHRPHGLPTWLTTMPEVLKDNGYTTYGIGKWHLGYCNDSYVPTNRGFDHFLGFYLGSVDYWSHRTSERGPYGNGKYNGFDFRDDGEKYEGQGIDGVYTSFLFKDRINKIISEHDDADPMYMYLAFQLPHSPVTVPDEYAALYNDSVTNEERRIYSGQVTFMDEIIGDVRDALRAAGMWRNTLVLFHSDNGGDVRHAASNYPLRGNKGTYFDGGIKATALVYGKGIRRTGYVNHGMIHAVDVFPTLVEAVGGEIDFEMDGVSAWRTISRGSRSERTGFLITVDEDHPETSRAAAIRDGKWKFIEGYPAFRYIETHLSWYPTPYHGDTAEGTNLPEDPSSTTVWLYDMEADPLEINNVADQYPNVVASLRAKLDVHRLKTWTDFPPEDPSCDPALYDGWWTSGWCTIA
ncbi:arylsulfatase B-like [Ptychodera flava]|uniref:arylsulfatase B-like n=1 Tax=Ptychodera flava TaxID=63121 RepID=UPI00396A9F5C